MVDIISRLTQTSELDAEGATAVAKEVANYLRDEGQDTAAQTIEADLDRRATADQEPLFGTYQPPLF